MRRFFSLVLLATLVFSCNKLELLEHSNTLDAGCLNPNATNYDAAAPSDDGSCTFGNCSITSVSTTEYTLVCPTQTTFSYGDSYILGLNVGQVTSAELFLNETAKYSFGLECASHRRFGPLDTGQMHRISTRFQWDQCRNSKQFCL